jgi:RHS repeat-associated protein
LSFLHTDPLNTPRLATDAQKQVVWRWEGKAFGDSQPTGGLTVNLRFAGQYYDAESGLHYNWNRYYDPKTGRYLTPDKMSVARHVRRWQGSLGQPGQGPLELNPYLYVSANPLRWVDPTGMYQCTYSITSHTMTCTPNDPSHGTFSSSDFVSGRNSTGCNDCQNNPNRTNVSDYGPIPVGTYNIGPLTPNGRRNLTPDPSNGRFGFQLHHCGTGPATCSWGCIASPNTWNQLNNALSQEEGDNTLTVTP